MRGAGALLLEFGNERTLHFPGGSCPLERYPIPCHTRILGICPHMSFATRCGVKNPDSARALTVGAGWMVGSDHKTGIMGLSSIAGVGTVRRGPVSEADNLLYD